MNLLIVFISILFDMLFFNLFKFTSFSISFFYPMFTVASIVFISNLYNYPNRKNYYYFTLIVSIIYDTIFINNLVISISLFLSVAMFNMFFKKHFSNNLFTNIIKLITSIFMYDFLFHLLLVIGRYQNFNINRVMFKTTHSIIINLLYIIIMFLVLKPKKA